MSKVEFTEVEDDVLKNNVNQLENENLVIDREELGIENPSSDDEIQHVYISFVDGITIDQGIDAIETQVYQGKELQISRRDDASNAIVAIISSKDTKTIEKLEEVSFVKIDKGAEKTDTTSASSTQDIEGKDTEENTNNTKGKAEETEISTDNSVEEMQETGDINSEVTTTVHDNNLDTNDKPSYTPIVIAIILGVVILLGIIINKSKR